MQYEIFTTQNKNKWVLQLHKFPENLRDVYFTPKFCELSEINGEGKAECFFYSEDGFYGMYIYLRKVDEFGNENIRTPYGYGGCIVSKDNPKAIENFENCFLQYAKKENFKKEFIRFHPLIKNQFIFSKNIKIEQNRDIIYLPLTNIDDIWKNEISSKNRNMIRKAEKNGLEVRILNENEFHLFKDLYIQRMKNLNTNEFYYFSDKYFEYLKDLLRFNGVVLGVFYNNKIIASACFFAYGKYFHYHLAGSDSNYLTLSPNNLLLYKAIQIACENNYKTFLFGGGKTSDSDDSLYKFKKSFSNHSEGFYIGERMHN